MGETVYFDESGYTGGDLLNSDQPIFSVASTIISDSESEHILKSSFPNYRGHEFKFIKIWRRHNNRKDLVKFSEIIKSHSEKIFVFYINKKFCNFTKFVDFLIEPILHDDGYDFYQDGYASKFCNTFKALIDRFCLPELYDSMLMHYQDFTKNPNSETLQIFINTLGIMAESVPEEVRDYFAIALEGAVKLEQYRNFSQQKNSNEIHLTTILSSVVYWKEKLKTEFDIIHDESSNFFRQAELWKKITDKRIHSKDHSQANGLDFSFPLNINKTMIGVSGSYRSIQICDIIAGLVSKACRADHNAQDAPFFDELMSAGLGELTVNSIQQGQNLTFDPPPILTGPDAVDRFVHAIFRR